MEAYALPLFYFLRDVLNKPKVIFLVYFFVCPLFGVRGLVSGLVETLVLFLLSSSAVGPVETVSLPQFFLQVHSFFYFMLGFF